MEGEVGGFPNCRRQCASRPEPAARYQRLVSSELSRSQARKFQELESMTMEFKDKLRFMVRGQAAERPRPRTAPAAPARDRHGSQGDWVGFCGHPCPASPRRSCN